MADKDPWEVDHKDPWEVDAEPVQVTEEPGILSKGLDYAGRGLDYAGGLTRTALLEALSGARQVGTGVDALVGGKSAKEALREALQARLVKEGEWTKALKGQAPGGSEILQRVGMPEGGALSEVLPSLYSETGEGLALQKGGALDPTTRGAAGLAIDIATDPMTYLTGGTSKLAQTALKPIPKLGKVAITIDKGLSTVLNPIETLGSKAGKSLYKAGLKRTDQIASRYGKVGEIAPSEILWREGVTGSNKQIAKKSEALLEKLNQKREELLDSAGDVYVDMDKATSPAEQLLREKLASKDPKIQRTAAALMSDIEDYKNLKAVPEQDVVREITSPLVTAKGDPIVTSVVETIPARPGITPKELSQMKSNRYSSIGSEAYNQAKQTPLGKQYEKALAKGMKQETERSLGKAGKELAKTNAELGSLLTAASSLDKEALKETTRNMLTPVDAIAYGASKAASGSAEEGIKTFLLKKLADLSKETWTRTKTGKGLYNVANIPGLDVATRRMLLQDSTEKEPTNPWESMK